MDTDVINMQVIHLYLTSKSAKTQ